jgi:hypothetical protein
MKITMLTVFLAINFAMEQESPAFVDCGYGALYYSEELLEDGPALETVPQDATLPAEPADSGSRDMSV